MKEVWYKMEFQKSAKCLVAEETKIRWFLKKLYEEKLLSNDEYVVAIKLIDEKYPSQRNR